MSGHRRDPYDGTPLAKPLEFTKLGQPSCRQHKGQEDMWFSLDEDEQRWAKRICDGYWLDGIEPCELRFECLQAAMENNIKFGIWGGLTAYQRTLLRNKK